MIAQGKITDKQEKRREAYAPPVLMAKGNLREVTFECPEWQCSIVVPPPPAP